MCLVGPTSLVRKYCNVMCPICPPSLIGVASSISPYSLVNVDSLVNDSRFVCYVNVLYDVIVSILIVVGTPWSIVLSCRVLTTHRQMIDTPY